MKTSTVDYLRFNPSTVSQVVACTIKNILIFEIGLAASFSTIVIPPLLKNEDRRGVTFTEDQASWFGSLVFICEPVGSLLSSIVLSPLGRKQSMIYLNIPFALSWLILYFATDVSQLYLASAIMGVAMGITETPILTYVGEISEPRLRGTMISYSNMFNSIGIFFSFCLGNMFEWRTAALVCLCLPVVSILALLMVPETPIWLLSRGRDEDALEALKWLRGWTTAEAVSDEFEDLKRYTISEAQRVLRETKPGVPLIVSKVIRGFQDTFRLPVLKPLGVMSVFFFLSVWTGIDATTPYLVLVGSELEFPIDSLKATPILGTLAVLGSAMCFLTIARFKKRPIALTSLVVAFSSCFLLALLPIGTGNGWPAFLAFCVLTFAYNYGISGISWTFVSEVFPFRGRSQACGIAVAFCYIGAFASSNTFLQLKGLMGIQQVFILYGAVSVAVLVLGYLFFPETEGISLEEIEKLYSSKRKTTHQFPVYDNEGFQQTVV